MSKHRKNNQQSAKKDEKNNKPTGYGDKKLVGPNRPAE